MGRLIPAGTGISRYRNLRLQAESLAPKETTVKEAGDDVVADDLEAA
jgi:hypothetical protein